MRKLLLSTTVMFAFSGVAGAGELITGGVGEIGGGYAFLSNSGTSEDAADDTARVATSGRFNIGATDNLSIQLDARGEIVIGDAIKNSGGGTSPYAGAFQGAAHVNWREPGQFLVGAFGSYGSARIKHEKDEQGYAFGPEAQYHFGNTTLYGQGGAYWSSENDSESLTDAFFIRGVVRHFLSPNSFVSAEGLYGFGDSTEETEADIDFVGWGLRYTHGFGDSPLAVFAGYEGRYMSSKLPGDKESVTEHVLMVGITFRFGANSFQHANTHGATLDVPLDMLRTTGYSADVID